MRHQLHPFARKRYYAQSGSQARTESDNLRLERDNRALLALVWVLLVGKRRHRPAELVEDIFE